LAPPAMGVQLPYVPDSKPPSYSMSTPMEGVGSGTCPMGYVLVWQSALYEQRTLAVSRHEYTLARVSVATARFAGFVAVEVGKHAEAVGLRALPYVVNIIWQKRSEFDMRRELKAAGMLLSLAQLEGRFV
jgi:hypothetical protein